MCQKHFLENVISKTKYHFSLKNQIIAKHPAERTVPKQLPESSQGIYRCVSEWGETLNSHISLLCERFFKFMCVLSVHCFEK